MKKHPQADALASRLAQAANTPVTVIPFTASQPAEEEAAPRSEAGSDATPTAAVEPTKPRTRRKARGDSASNEEADDTVPISLRPHRKLLTRYINAASDRMRETGRMISAQQIMLEVLERGP
jgi:hypothetical protein